MVASLPKYNFTLDFSHLQLFHFLPWILPESV